jgi:hypothetical protein
MKDMTQIGHNGTFVSNSYLAESQAKFYSSEKRRANLMVKFGCGGLAIGALATGTFVIGGLMFIDGHFRGDADQVINGKTTMEVATGMALVSGASFSVAGRCTRLS